MPWWLISSSSPEPLVPGSDSPFELFEPPRVRRHKKQCFVVMPHVSSTLVSSSMKPEGGDHAKGFPLPKPPPHALSTARSQIEYQRESSKCRTRQTPPVCDQVILRP